uniref:Uncharacterized protein n=1 Tax=Lotharella oceanica TaxID=641309 RepID=A0A7S2U495_9EUKA|mmetsp:Transcript_7857/g.15406  ORF Transcript_7857/g.15406 Transcript_7857/m.15406 type:complete len:142 (+) Transcript_7857:157-582(+)
MSEVFLFRLKKAAGSENINTPSMDDKDGDDDEEEDKEESNGLVLSSKASASSGNNAVGIGLAVTLGLISIIALGIFLKRWALEAFNGHQRRRRDPSSSSSSSTRNAIQFSSLPSSASAADLDGGRLVVEPETFGAGLAGWH